MGSTNKRVPSDTPQWRKKWEVERARGVKRMRTTHKVRAHIEWLISQGFNCAAIAAAAGVDRGTVLDARSGRNRMITSRVEKKIMAVTPDAIYARPDRRGYVPAVGAVRRLQALITMGWRYQDLTPRLGFPAEGVAKNKGGWVSRYKHEAIVRLYDELWDKQGPGMQCGITAALNRGWHKPMAWDDDTIDDPAAEPFGTVRRVA